MYVYVWGICVCCVCACVCVCGVLKKLVPRSESQKHKADAGEENGRERKNTSAQRRARGDSTLI